MKKLLLLLALVVIFIFVVLFFQRRQPLELTEKKPRTEEAPAPPAEKKSFQEVRNLLEADLTKVAVSFNSPRQTPANAYSIKDRLRGATDRHPEYQILDKVCDLLIYADMERSVRQRDLEIATNRIGAGSLETGNAAGRVHNDREAVRQQAEQSWNDYSRQTQAEVHRLLDSLRDKSL